MAGPSVVVNLAGEEYIVAFPGADYGLSLSNYLVAIADPENIWQKDTTVFTLENDVNLGPTYGLKVKYISSQSDDAAAAGVFRLANNESIAWRNFTNDADLVIKYDTSNNFTINGSTVGSVTSVAATGSTGLAVGGSPITTSGTLTFTLDSTLQALSAYNTNGILTQTAADTFTGRTLTGTSNRITVTNGNGVSGNPTVDVSATYVGQTSITTLGTVATGVWNGTTLAIANGGSGQVTANLAFNAFAPSQTSNSGKFLTTNGTDTSWATVAGGITGLGNPTTPGVNLVGANGVATTAMRSDAVLILDQTISPTMSGSWIFSQSVTGNSFVPTSSSVPLNGLYAPSAGTLGLAANTTSVLTSTSSLLTLAIVTQINQRLTLSNTTPTLRLDETDGALNERLMDARVSGGTFFIRTLDDAAAAGATWLSVSRTGTAVNTITLGDSTNNNTYSFSSTGTATFNGQVTSLRFVPTSSTIATNGMYLPAGNTIGLSANSTQVLSSTSTLLTVPIAAALSSTLVVTSTATAASFIPTSSTTPTNGLYLAGANNPSISANSVKTLSATTTGVDITGITTSTSDLKVTTAGKGLFIKEGSNAKMGQSTLVGGTVTVSTTAVTASSRIFLTHANSSGVIGELSVGTTVAGTSFVINGLATDTSLINWLIIEPA